MKRVPGKLDSRSKKGRAYLIPVSGIRLGPRIRPTDHGVSVDDAIARWVEAGVSESTDPCVRSIIWATHARGWVPLGAQVPVALPHIGAATAVDLICTDSATRTKLIICEIKATRSGAGDAATACYEVARARVAKTGPWAGLGKSRCAEHQLQLWAMVDGIQAAGIDVDEAVVIRASKRGAAVYPLIPWWTESETRTKLMRKALRVGLGPRSRGIPGGSGASV